MRARSPFPRLMFVLLAAACGRESSSSARVILLSPPSTLPPGLAREVLARGFARATARWSYPAIACTSLRVDLSAPSAVRIVGEDGVNSVVFRTAVWCHNERCGNVSTFPLRAAAMTTTYPESSEPGRIREADVELNAVHFAWGASSGRPQASIEVVLTHEIGHVLGFPDVCRKAPCSESEATSVMRSGTTTMELSPWDIERLCKAFPR